MTNSPSSLTPSPGVQPIAPSAFRRCCNKSQFLITFVALVAIAAFLVQLSRIRHQITGLNALLNSKEGLILFFLADLSLILMSINSCYFIERQAFFERQAKRASSQQNSEQDTPSTSTLGQLPPQSEQGTTSTSTPRQPPPRRRQPPLPTKFTHMLRFATLCGVDPQQHTDPKEMLEWWMQVARNGDTKELKELGKVIAFYPDLFQANGQDIVHKLLSRGHTIEPSSQLAIAIKGLCDTGKIDRFHQMWLAIANRDPVSQAFRNDFESLTAAEQKILYEAAFIFDNPLIRAPADLPTTTAPYSINLVHINRLPNAYDQEFLIGDGNTSEERQLDFDNRFVTPVVEWTKHSSSEVTIWFDSKTVNGKAIDRSCNRLQDALTSTNKDAVQFKNIRDISYFRDYEAQYSASDSNLRWLLLQVITLVQPKPNILLVAI